MTPAPRDLGGVAGLHRRTRSRATGTVVGLYDARRAGIDVDPAIPWATVCEDHSTSVCHSAQAAALKAMADPSSWCEECRNGVAAGTPELRAQARAIAKRMGPWKEKDLNPNTGFPTVEATENAPHRRGFAGDSDRLALLLSRISSLENGDPDPALPDPRLERPEGVTGEEQLSTSELEVEIAMVEDRITDLRAELRAFEAAVARKRGIIAKRDPKRIDPLLAKGGAFCTPCVKGTHEGCVGPGCGCNCANGPTMRQYPP